MPAEKILLLAGLGLAAYVFTQRSASAGTLYGRNQGQTPAANLFARQNRSPSNPNASSRGIYDPQVMLAGTIGQLANRWFGSGSSNTQPATPASPAYTPFEANYPYTSSSSVDGVAANPSQDNSIRTIDVYDQNGYGAG